MSVLFHLPFLNHFSGSLLETNLVKAVEMESIQRKAADDFTATFPPDTIRGWRRMVREWESDSSRPNPYISNDRSKFSPNFSEHG